MPELHARRAVFEVLVVQMTFPGICAQRLERLRDPYLEPYIREALHVAKRDAFKTSGSFQKEDVTGLPV